MDDFSKCLAHFPIVKRLAFPLQRMCTGCYCRECAQGAILFNVHRVLFLGMCTLTIFGVIEFEWYRFLSHFLKGLLRKKPHTAHRTAWVLRYQRPGFDSLHSLEIFIWILFWDCVTFTHKELTVHSWSNPSSVSFFRTSFADLSLFCSRHHS